MIPRGQSLLGSWGTTRRQRAGGWAALRRRATGQATTYIWLSWFFGVLPPLIVEAPWPAPGADAEVPPLPPTIAEAQSASLLPNGYREGVIERRRAELRLLPLMDMNFSARPVETNFQAVGKLVERWSGGGYLAALAEILSMGYAVARVNRDSDSPVTHSLGYIPTTLLMVQDLDGYGRTLIGRPDATFPGGVSGNQRAWTSDTIYLRCTGTEASGRFAFFVV